MRYETLRLRAPNKNNLIFDWNKINRNVSKRLRPKQIVPQARAFSPRFWSRCFPEELGDKKPQRRRWGIIRERFSFPHLIKKVPRYREKASPAFGITQPGKRLRCSNMPPPLAPAHFNLNSRRESRNFDSYSSNDKSFERYRGMFARV